MNCSDVGVAALMNVWLWRFDIDVTSMRLRGEVR